MEATESPAKMEIDTNGTAEATEAEAGNPAASTTTEAATEKEADPSPAPSGEGAAPAEEAAASAPSDVKMEESSEEPGTTGAEGTATVEKAEPTPSSPPKDTSVAAAPAETAQPEKTESPAKAAADNASEGGATAQLVSSSPSAKTATAAEPKGSPNSIAISKTASAVKVTKVSTAKVSAKTTTAAAAKSLKKGARKKRKTAGLDDAEEKGAPQKTKKVKRKKDEVGKAGAKGDKTKKVRKQTKKSASGMGSLYADHLNSLPGLSAAQMAVQEQMRKALEEDQYSANGSIVDTDSDDDGHQYVYKGQSIRLDRAHLMQAAKKYGWFFGDMNGAGSILKANKDEENVDEEEGILNADGSTNNDESSTKKKSTRNKKKGRNQYTTNRTNETAKSTSNNFSGFRIDEPTGVCVEAGKPKNMSFLEKGESMERDEGSIFGQTTGASNSTWVECDKCKKWRRLRGVVDHSKLPKKWYCSMNRNDPERARCSAPEEEYDAPITPESAADARTRKHLRVWVRRLQCNEQFESRLPTMTRGKKRSVVTNSKEPHEWIRCCNPSCGKWRAILRSMDAKQNVIDRTLDGEWYCVMNTWDEKTASCAAPQENLPAVGCPPWVLQDEN